jgi:hypothetical protein
VTLKELADYKKNLDELKAFRAFGLTPYQMGLALEGATIAQKQLSVYQQHGIWPDNVHLFQLVETQEAAPLPINLNDDTRCVHCDAMIDKEGSWDCWSCNQKGKNHV